ncbi:MAG: hypothetical protein Phog2KO_45290 [Phototrophicaceae bacterium]
MSHIFVSYSRKDTREAQQIVDYLRDNGIDTWIDWKDIPISANWWAEIQSGIENSDAFIFFASENSSKSVVCQLEVEYAISTGKRIIPIVLGDVWRFRDDAISYLANTNNLSHKQLIGDRDIVEVSRNNWEFITRINWIFSRDDDVAQMQKSLLVAINETETDRLQRQTRSTDVFIEYSRKDMEFAKFLTDQLEAIGLQVWADWKDIPPATDWWQEIKYGIENTHYVLFIVTPDSLKSEIITQSLEYERQLIKRIIPIILERPTNHLEGIGNESWLQTARDNWQYLEKLNWIFADEEETHSVIGNIVQLIRDEYLQIHMHRYLLVQSLQWDRHGRQSDNLLSTKEVEIIDTWLQSTNLELTNVQQEYLVQSKSRSTSLQSRVGRLFNRNEDVIAEPLERFAKHREPTHIQNLAVTPEEIKSNLVSDDTSTIKASVEGQNLQGHSSWISRISWSRDGSQLASASGDGTVKLWDVVTRQNLFTLSGHSGEVYSVVWSANAGLIASGGDDNSIRIWDTNAGSLLRTLQGHQSRVESLAWSPDGQLLASASADATVKLWNPNTGELLRSLQYNNWVNTVDWSPDGTNLVTGDETNSVIIWDARTGEKIRTLNGHSHRVVSGLPPVY